MASGYRLRPCDGLSLYLTTSPRTNRFGCHRPLAPSVDQVSKGFFQSPGLGLLKLYYGVSAGGSIYATVDYCPCHECHRLIS